MTASTRRSFGPTVTAGLAAAALAAVGAGRGWAEATTTAHGARSAVATGTDVAPLVLPLALVALASWGAVLVLRSRGRRVVAVLGLAAACGAAVAALAREHAAVDVAVTELGNATVEQTSTTVWPFVCVAGCVVTAIAFAVAVARSSAWPQMSGRYDSPAGRPAPDPAAEPSQTELWRALDEGRDPTA